mmetsp:Transcript_18988/g.65257  ORF Transcript_18988/g.65257 Transcript_18988/m.65257 type:complete len:354 (-) Transcript_18988:1341-2402(-)
MNAVRAHSRGRPPAEREQKLDILRAVRLRGVEQRRPPAVVDVLQTCAQRRAPRARGAALESRVSGEVVSTQERAKHGRGLWEGCGEHEGGGAVGAVGRVDVEFQVGFALRREHHYHQVRVARVGGGDGERRLLLESVSDQSVCAVAKQERGHVARRRRGHGQRPRPRGSLGGAVQRRRAGRVARVDVAPLGREHELCDVLVSAGGAGHERSAPRCSVVRVVRVRPQSQPQFHATAVAVVAAPQQRRPPLRRGQGADVRREVAKLAFFISVSIRVHGLARRVAQDLPHRRRELGGVRRVEDGIAESGSELGSLRHQISGAPRPAPRQSFRPHRHRRRVRLQQRRHGGDAAFRQG